MATENISLRYLRCVLLVAVVASTAALAPPVSEHVVKNDCYHLYLESLPKQSPSLMLRGIGLVQKHLTQAAELITNYRDNLLSHRLYNKTLPKAVNSYNLPEPPRSDAVSPGGSAMAGNLVDLFHRLAVSCLLFENLAHQEQRVGDLGWNDRLKNITGELVDSLCHMHVLLYISSYRLSHASLRVINQLFAVSLTSPPWVPPHEDREWRFLRDYAITGAVHRVTQKSIVDLQVASRQWQKPVFDS